MGQPWRRVLDDPEPALHEGRGSVLGPDTSRWTRWWQVTLECGHLAEPFVRYAPKGPGESPWKRARPLSAVLPPPKRLRCHGCDPAD